MASGHANRTKNAVDAQIAASNRMLSFRPSRRIAFLRSNSIITGSNLVRYCVACLNAEQQSCLKSGGLTLVDRGFMGSPELPLQPAPWRVCMSSDDPELIA
jgi:hypothetical protein